MTYQKHSYLKVGQYEMLNDCVIGFITQCVSVGDESSLARHGVDMSLARKICKTSLTEREHLIKSNHPLLSIVFDADRVESYLDENAHKDSIPSPINSRYADLHHAALKLLTKNKASRGLDHLFLNDYGLTRELASRILHIPMGIYNGLISTPEPLAQITFRSDIINMRMEQNCRSAGDIDLSVQYAKLGASIHMVELLFGLTRYAYRELRMAHGLPKGAGRPKALTRVEINEFEQSWLSHKGMDFESRLIAATEAVGCTMIRSWNYMISVTVDIHPDKMTKSDLSEMKEAWMNEKPVREGVAA